METRLALLALELIHCDIIMYGLPRANYYKEVDLNLKYQYEM